MVKSMLIGVTLAAAAGPAFAQGNIAQGNIAQGSAQRNCLHAGAESAADRARRQQAIDYAMKVNVAETLWGIGPRQNQRYRPLDELANLPAVPAGFAIEFHNDDRGYVLSLKDTRDTCRYAIFTDQDRLIYEAVPKTDAGGIVPLGTR
jgi:hypothetical protein